MAELHHMISVEELGNGKFKSTVTFDGEIVKNAFDKSIKSINKSVKVNGFRPGKVPAKILKKFYFEKIMSAATNLLMDEGFRLIVTENKIMPLSDPMLSKINTPPNEEDGFEFEMEFNGMLEIDPIGYLNMQLEVPKYNIEQSIDEYIKFLMSQYAEFTPIEIIEDGASIKCDYSIKLGENSIGEDKNQLVPIYDTKLTIFGSDLIGAKVGDTVEYKYTLPEDFPKNPGEEVTIIVSVKEIMKKKALSIEELTKLMKTTEEELMNFAKTQVINSLERNNRSILSEQIINKLLETNQFEPPKILVDQELLMTKIKQNHSNCKDNHCEDNCCSDSGCGNSGCEDNGCGDNCKCKHEHNEEKECLCNDVDTDIIEKAKKSIRSAYILNRIYNMEANLKLTNEEIAASLDMEAQMRGINKYKLLKQIKKTNAYTQFIGGLRSRKVVAFILNNATITEKEIDMENKGD